MAPSSNAFRSMPPRSTAAIATIPSQLLGTLAFALAFVWIYKFGDRRPVSLTIGVLGAVCVFAGGKALRGSVLALAVCAFLDLSVAIACLTDVARAKAFVLTPIAWLAPTAANPLVITIAGVVAVVAASMCIVAVPQIRQFAAWRGEQVLHAAR